MELRQLRYFVAVAQEAHFGRAARRLHVVQPALTRQIRKLEEELGTTLFLRHSRGAKPTEDGVMLLERVTRLLNEVDTLAEEFTGRQEQLKGEVIMGLSLGLAEKIGSLITTSIARRHPGVKLRMMGSFTPLLDDLVLQGLVDFAVLNNPLPRPGLTLRPLVRDALCLVCRVDDERFAGDRVQLDELVGVPLVLCGLPGTGLRRTLQLALTRAGTALTIAAEVDTVAASNELVLAGRDPTIHVASMAQAANQSGRLRVIPINDLYVTRTLAVADRKPISPAASATIAALIALIGDLIVDHKWPGAELLREEEFAFPTDSSAAEKSARKKERWSAELDRFSVVLSEAQRVKLG